MHVFLFTGVDIVLNSLAEEKLQASVRTLAMHGKFLEIGKFDLFKNSALGMIFFSSCNIYLNPSWTHSPIHR